MININIPGKGDCQVKSLVLDFNGTLARDGELLAGIESRLTVLSALLDVYVVTADTFGSVREMVNHLDVTVHILEKGDETQGKLDFINHLQPENVCAIGNGQNDAAMLKAANISIAVIGSEGVSTQALLSANVITHSIDEALDLLIKPLRLKATLRC
ncbi:HAD family hydrolase [Vibrio sp. DW001]|uniref:HAD family hydrolase n=1 Tax=Vibrio sp. DW001 TaxID=2912315 RepID=UPI0023B08289|nr:HAD hydrolase family protein [Vibrio sp. DW001]WED25220.1 HAD family hydrolase [Vibrio sp. DW001]